MHPVSTLLLLVGYALALPLVMRAGSIPTRLQRVGLAGHQMGMLIAALGWAVRSRPLMAVIHLAWALAAKVVLRWIRAWTARHRAA